MLGKLPNLLWGKQKAEPAPASQGKQPSNKKPEPADAPNSSEHAQTLLNDNSQKKRLAACSHVKDSNLLLTVSKNDSSEQVRLAAARQYARTLPTGDDTRQLLQQYTANEDNRYLAKLITALHSDTQIREYGLSHFNTDNDYRDIAIETRFHDTRDQVTDKIESLDIVDAVWRQIKTKDKEVARKLKQRLQEHQSSQALATERKVQVDKIIDEMDKLANGAWSPNYVTRYDLFLNRWQALDFDIGDEDKQRFNELQIVAHEKVEKNRERQQAEDSAKADAERLQQITKLINSSRLETLPAALQKADADAIQIRTSWLDETSAHFQLIGSSQQQQIKTDINKLDAAIRQGKTAANAFAQVNTSDAIDFDSLKAHQRVLGKATKSQQGGKDQPVYAAELPALLKSVESKLRELTKDNEELKRSLQKQFGSLNSAINSSKWGPARSIYERLDKKIAKLPSGDQPALKDKLSNFEKRLNELGDWKQFATDPKLEALCEEMENLPSHKLSPKDQADRIKEIQERWKAMGASPAQEKHWPRFKAAADIAFAPCAEYFARRRENKEQTLAQRQEILTMLKEYTEQVNWDNPDWRLVEKTIRTAKNEWRKLKVYDRKATAPQEAAFTEVLSTLNSKMAPAYEQGKQEKQDLIQRVKTLGEGDINQHCINQVKRLQAQWRRTGIVERADDQSLWKEFNEACSEIYTVHRGKQREQYAASVEHVTRARDIIKQLRQAGTTDKLIDEKDLQQLQDEFNSLPEFPEKEQKFLFRDFNRAIDGLDKQRDRHSETALKQEIQRLRGNASVCDQLEALAGSPIDDISTRVEQLLSEWDDGQKTDNMEWRKAINLRRDSIVAHLQSNTVPDFAANTKARRLLCIDLEILLDKETPTEDKELRMQHQLDQLQQGISSSNANSHEEQVQAMEVGWLTAFPAQADQRDKLNTRFTTVLSG